MTTIGNSCVNLKDCGHLSRLSAPGLPKGIPALVYNEQTHFSHWNFTSKYIFFRKLLCILHSYCKVIHWFSWRDYGSHVMAGCTVALKTRGQPICLVWLTRRIVFFVSSRFSPVAPNKQPQYMLAVSNAVCNWLVQWSLGILYMQSVKWIFGANEKNWYVKTNLWSLGTDKLFYATLYNGYNYLSMLGLELNHVSKRGPRWHPDMVCLGFGKCCCYQLCELTDKHNPLWMTRQVYFLESMSNYVATLVNFWKGKVSFWI